MKKKNIFLWVIFLIFLTTYNFNLNESPTSLIFKIKKIQVKGVEYSNISEIEESLKIFNSKNLVTINPKDIIKSISDKDFVKSIIVKKIYPDKIEIIIQEENPVAILAENELKYILVENGNIIKNYNNRFDSLPFVYGKSASQYFYKFYKKLKSIDFDTSTIDHLKYFESNRWDIIFKNDKILKLPSEDDRTLESLKKFMTIYNKENFKRFKVFDFRVKNQLIIK